MRKSITLFDDQYAFYKELKSDKLLISFVEYMFEDKEPEGLNSLEQTIWNSLLVRMNNQKSKSNAGAKSKGGGRPKKQAKEQQKNNKKTTEKQQVEDISISRSISNKIEENIITNSNELVEQSSTSYGDKDINDLINSIKEQCNSTGVAYDKYKDRYFAKFILTAKEFGDFAEKIGQSRVEFALNVLKASVQIKFRKGICSGPMKIYQNYTEVYNETLRQHSKNQKNLIQSF